MNYTELINKMVQHFSIAGSIVYSKACDYEGLYPITANDISLYYELLCSNENKNLPPNFCQRNHLTCCLYYLTRQDEKYKKIFLDRFLKTLDDNDFDITEDNLVFMFNIIEFDKMYLKSPTDHIMYLYSYLKKFSSFPASFDNYLLYKYYRGYIKYRQNDVESANTEYLEIVAESSDVNQTVLIKYIKLKNNLLKLKMFNFRENMERGEYIEYCQFLIELYGDAKKNNKILALKLGLNLFSAYLTGKNFEACIPLLLEMKKILKKELLKGTTMKNGIYYYLAIASRLGYLGILLDNSRAKISALKKIKKALNLVNKNDVNMDKIVKTYSFIKGILEISIDNKIDFDLKNLAFDFQNSLLPDLNSFNNYIINEQNFDDSIINLNVANSMNTKVAAKDVLTKITKLLAGQQDNSNFRLLTFISAVHDKVCGYVKSYLTDSSEKRKEYIQKICDYVKGCLNIIYKFSEKDPILNTPFAQSMIIDILSSYAHIFIYKKDLAQLKSIYNTIEDLVKLLKIPNNTHAFGLINKIKGDYWFYIKDYKAALKFYENALNLIKEGSIIIPSILYNCACAQYLFDKDRKKCREYLSKCIEEFNKLDAEKKVFDYKPEHKHIIDKINSAKNLLNQLK